MKILLGLSTLLLSTTLYANVIVYTMTNCEACEQVKSYLNQNNVNYSECNIENESCKSELNSLGFEVTPVTNINGTLTVGYEQPRLRNLLIKHGYMKPRNSE